MYLSRLSVSSEKKTDPNWLKNKRELLSNFTKMSGIQAQLDQGVLIPDDLIYLLSHFLHVAASLCSNRPIKSFTGSHWF